MNPDNIDIVLVHTTHSGNIGGVARAMKNMGLTRLTLVAPLEYPAPEATWRAASAGDVLENARVVDTLDEAIAAAHPSPDLLASLRDRRVRSAVKMYEMAAREPPPTCPGGFP